MLFVRSYKHPIVPKKKIDISSNILPQEKFFEDPETIDEIDMAKLANTIYYMPKNVNRMMGLRLG